MTQVTILAGFMMLFLSACGEDDGEGGAPDLFLGASGVIIVLVVGYLLWRAMAKRR